MSLAQFSTPIIKSCGFCSALLHRGTGYFIYGEIAEERRAEELSTFWKGNSFVISRTIRSFLQRWDKVFSTIK